MLSVRDSRELQATVLAIKGADRELRREINRATVQTGNAIWKPLVEAHASRPMDARVLTAGARIKGGNPPTAIAASSRRAIGKGRRLVPAEHWHAWEFGANREDTTTYQRRSPRGTVHQVTRRTKRHLPPRTRGGRVVYPAFAEAAPRMVSLWVQLTVRLYRDAAERKR